MDHDKIRTNLSAYKDDEVKESLRGQISGHLQVCDACREELRELDQIDSLVKGLPVISASENFTFQIIAKTQVANAYGYWELGLPRKILDRFLHIVDSVFELLREHELHGGSLDEFGDSPPLSLSHAYFQLIGHSERG